ncbi:hypothetical protein HYV50_01730 [Candidatus Pacearchaeota archaeon]|nr:hypothetical protein [Candidatus Pacearchaeota archaeon]
MTIARLYVAGIIVVILGLMWLFIPQTYNSLLLEKIKEADSESSEGSILETIPYGLIIVLTGLALIGISNKYERKTNLKIPYFTELASVLSISAGLLHAALITDHFREWWGYGLFFIIVAMVQVSYGMIFLFQVRRHPRGVIKSKKSLEFLYVCGLAGNLFIIMLYIITRTIGIPFFGPEAGRVEDVSPIDIFSKGLEIGLIVVVIYLMRFSYSMPENRKADYNKFEYTKV